MPRHIVEISDESGYSFRIQVDINQTGRGTWRSLDKGAIKINSGVAKFSKPQTTYAFDDDDLVLCANSQAQYGGIRLNNYIGVFTTNDEGMGYLVQQWCLTMKPYRISWVLAD